MITNVISKSIIEEIRLNKELVFKHMKIKADPNIDIIGIAGNIYLINLTSKLPVIKRYGSTHERKSMAIVLVF